MSEDEGQGVQEDAQTDPAHANEPLPTPPNDDLLILDSIDVWNSISVYERQLIVAWRDMLATMHAQNIGQLGAVRLTLTVKDFAVRWRDIATRYLNSKKISSNPAADLPFYTELVDHLHEPLQVFGRDGYYHCRRCGVAMDVTGKVVE